MTKDDISPIVPASVYFDAFAVTHDILAEEGFFGDPLRFHQMVSPHLTSHAKVLVIGIAGGQRAKPFDKDGHDVHGIDISEKMLSITASKRIATAEKLHLIDVSKSPIPYANESFDAVISNGVIPYTPDVKLHLTEATRVLKDTGSLCLSFTPSASNDVEHKLVNVRSYDENRPSAPASLNMYNHPVTTVTSTIFNAIGRQPKIDQLLLEYARFDTNENVHFQYQLY